MKFTRLLIIVLMNLYRVSPPNCCWSIVQCCRVYLFLSSSSDILTTQLFFLLPRLHSGQKSGLIKMCTPEAGGRRFFLKDALPTFHSTLYFQFKPSAPQPLIKWILNDVVALIIIKVTLWEKVFYILHSLQGVNSHEVTLTASCRV